MSIMFQRPRIDVPDDQITEIGVSLILHDQDGAVVPALLYDGKPAEGLQIPVNSNSPLIRFQFRPTPEQQVQFQFTGANIVPTYADGTVYGDLSIISISDDTITIEDKHLHGSEHDPDVAVGAVSLFYFLTLPHSPAASFRSDPEIINTGRF